MSSATAPKDNDTEAVIAPNPLWDAILPIFNHYYELAGAGRGEDHNIVLRDIAELEKMSHKFVVPIEAAYKSLNSRSRNLDMKDQREKKAASSSSSMLRLLGLRRRE